MAAGFQNQYAVVDSQRNIVLVPWRFPWQLDRPWWVCYWEQLQRDFGQQSIVVVRAVPMHVFEGAA